MSNIPNKRQALGNERGVLGDTEEHVIRMRSGATLKAPIPYFGGKSKVAARVWKALGDVDNYVEPFCGSAAVLLARPTPPKIETINDFDCVAPETKILYADLTWRQAGEVQTGDVLLAFDEENGDPRPGLRAPARYRHWRFATVLAVRRTVKPCYRLTFDDGTTVVSSADHLWLGGSHRTGGRGWRWQRTAGMVCNRKTQRSWVLKLAPVVSREETHDAGWLAGMYEGEGNVRGWQIVLSQKAGKVLDRAAALLRERGYEFRIGTSTSGVSQLEVLGGMRQTLRILMQLRPQRLIDNIANHVPNASLYGRTHQAVGLVKKEFLGDQEVVAIQTDSRTFVAEGLASHNCYVANFWRATAKDPEAVAAHADYPVSECDLHARHRWLVLSDEAKAFRKRMRKDPEYYDPRIAGWWCWGMCCWIGGGWCKVDQLERHQNSPPQLLGDRGGGRKGKKGSLKDARPRLDGRGGNPKTSAVQPGVLKGPEKAVGLKNSRPAIDHVHGRMDVVVKNVDSGGKKPRLTGGRKGDEYYGGLGVHADGGEAGNRPQLADAYSRGRGVHGDDSRGTCQERREWLIGWFNRLRDRLRTVRVCCGDWLRVCDSESVTTRLGVTGVFFDPPYSAEAGRDMTIYASESGTVAHDVRQYCLERGGDKMMRIALCGYEGEGHEELEKHGWTVVKWKSSGGYGNQTEKGKANARKERIWFSPHCTQKKMGFLY